MRHQVLLVDDEPVLLSCLRLYLEGEGYHALTARSGTTALEMLQTQRPDVIICDLHMPEMDGVRFRQRVRQNPSWQTIPFVLLTGLREPSLRQGFELAGDELLIKPFEPEDLLTILAKSLKAS
jgi:CheY-like chemotaxis protein